jgi:hypothetical protein
MSETADEYVQKRTMVEAGSESVCFQPRESTGRSETECSGGMRRASPGQKAIHLSGPTARDEGFFVPPPSNLAVRRVREAARPTRNVCSRCGARGGLKGEQTAFGVTGRHGGHGSLSFAPIEARLALRLMTEGGRHDAWWEGSHGSDHAPAGPCHIRAHLGCIPLLQEVQFVRWSKPCSQQARFEPIGASVTVASPRCA